ncbi:MAG: FtsQ-type POTRA domain-containing protein [Candidatus Cloacimonadaceae bacterium]|nr:FtsQ-type POTRA domain-containing protein [Candidatus Cloacimonadaceae bacterium]MDP3113617.1 FtsQ-type POTRA domain-containing protein [Candidatus Cloacimonadaceae bacterium]
MKTETRKRRGNSRYYLFFVLSLVIVTSVGAAAYLVGVNLPWIDLQEIKISGNSSISDSTIIAIINPYMDTNLLSIPSSEIEKKILRFARVKDVKIKKSLLHTLVCEIEERSGLLYLRSVEGDLFPIDKDAVVLEKPDNIYREDLPIVATYLSNKQLTSGTKLQKPYLKRIIKIHQDICAQSPDFSPLISEYYFIDDTIYLVDAKYGTRIIPCENNIAKQLQRYLFVQDNGNIDRNSLVDLRFDNQVVVKEGK